MKIHEYRKLELFLKGKHPDLLNKFAHVFDGLGSGDLTFIPMKADEIEYNELMAIIDKWKTDNNVS